MLNLDLAGSTAMHVGNVDVRKLLDLHRGRSVALACCNPAAFHTCSDRSDTFWMKVCIPNLFECCDRSNPKYIPNINVEAPAQVEIV